jgi:type III pantothenate kinase
MILLFDVGNTNTHLALANSGRIVSQRNIPTTSCFSQKGELLVKAFVRGARIEGAVLCSVVPRATPKVSALVRQRWNQECLELTPKTLRGVGVDYPKPNTIGPDRLANAVAVKDRFGAPSVVVDFGTAVTFDVVNRAGNYAGGIIAPGLAAMTEYLHEKTALLPRIRIREVNGTIGKSTEQAMLIGAVHGYRGLVRELIQELKAELRIGKLPVVATGGYAELIASKIPEITQVDPLITLEGLRIVWETHRKESELATRNRQPDDARR